MLVVTPTGESLVQRVRLAMNHHAQRCAGRERFQLCQTLPVRARTDRAVPASVRRPRALRSSACFKYTNGVAKTSTSMATQSRG